MTAIYIIDDLKKEIQNNLREGKLEVRHINQKDLPEQKRKYFYTRKYKGDRIEFHYNNQVKILNEGI